MMVDGVVARLRELDGELAPGDGVAVFNGMYLAVTEEVRDRLAGGRFDDPAAVAELDVLFAGRYLAAVAADQAGRRPAACWRPLFTARRQPGVHPVQFALAGISAHVEHDLPLAVVDTCRSRRCPPQQLSADYHRINDVLADLEARVREQLMPGPDPLEAADPLTHLVGCWSLDRARDAAWASAQALWALHRLPPAYAALATALDESVGAVCRRLLTPLVRRRSGGGQDQGGQDQLECSGLPSA
ncbi:DUF5995 family protein [Streptomyces sp. NPDC092296]|uniref:DUF5995 family protein n=1 Tax=Streptomyces sp. NPDC092296 TaxID=3366012 RepID=UPI003824CAA6